MGEVRHDSLKVVMGVCGDKEIANKEDQIIHINTLMWWTYWLFHIL